MDSVHVTFAMFRSCESPLPILTSSPSRPPDADSVMGFSIHKINQMFAETQPAEVQAPQVIYILYGHCNYHDSGSVNPSITLGHMFFQAITFWEYHIRANCHTKRTVYCLIFRSPFPRRPHLCHHLRTL